MSNNKYNTQKCIIHIICKQIHKSVYHIVYHNTIILLYLHNTISLHRFYTMIQSEDFFIKENEVTVPDEDYKSLTFYEQFLDTFARTTHKTIYVIDYCRKNFLYVSDNPLFLCGVPAKKVKEIGCEFYIQQVPDYDLPLLLEINKAGFLFNQTIPIEDLLDYTLSYDFHIKQPSGQALLINHKTTPLRLSKEGKVWLAFCAVSFSSHSEAGNLEIIHKQYNLRWTYNFESKKWKESKKIEIKEAEKNVLRLSAQGYTMNEIAERLYKSIDTIKSYKRELFEKLEVDNIAEAISYAVNKNLM